MAATLFPSSERVQLFLSGSVVVRWLGGSAGRVTQIRKHTHLLLGRRKECDTHIRAPPYHSTKNCGSGILSTCGQVRGIIGVNPMRHPPRADRRRNSSASPVRSIHTTAIRRWNHSLIVLAACSLLWPEPGGSGKNKNYPRLPHAVLLTGFPGTDLVLTTPKSTLLLQEHEQNVNTEPGLSRDGMVVVTARQKVCPPAPCRPLVLATYSVADASWKEYLEIPNGNGFAISPDGAAVAYAVREQGHAAVHLHFLDLKTGQETVSPVIGKTDRIRMNWSPDGRKIVFEMTFLTAEYRPLNAIEILDIQTGQISKIALGQAPAWSPSGEWIAYYEPADPGSNLRRLWRIHPDGSRREILLKAPVGSIYSGQPVWSPDSKSILINEFAEGEKGTMDIYLFDLADHKLNVKFWSTYPVFGWAESK